MVSSLSFASHAIEWQIVKNLVFIDGCLEFIAIQLCHLTILNVYELETSFYRKTNQHEGIESSMFVEHGPQLNRSHKTYFLILDVLGCKMMSFYSLLLQIGHHLIPQQVTYKVTNMVGS